MKSCAHPTTNHTFNAPDNWDSVMPCDPLPVTIERVGDLPCVSSYWEPSIEELAKLNMGQKVKLWIVGQGMPPVILSVEE